MANPYEPPRSAEESLELDEDTLFIVADGSVYCRSYVDLSWACLVTGETALQQVNTVSIQCSPIWLEIIGLPMILLTSIFWPHEATRQLALVASSMWWFVLRIAFGRIRATVLISKAAVLPRWMSHSWLLLLYTHKLRATRIGEELYRIDNLPVAFLRAVSEVSNSK